MKGLMFVLSMFFCLTCDASYLKKESDSVGNQNISYNNGEDKFFLYPEIKGGNEFNDYNLRDGYISATKKYGIVSRLVKSSADVSEKDRYYSEVNKCDVVDFSSGCIRYTIENDCDARWDGDDLVVNNQVISKDQQNKYLKDIHISPPGKMVKELAFISKSKNLYMGDIFFMNGETYASCFPVNKENESVMNDIGYYLALGGLNETALSIYKVVEAFNPNRMVLMLNMADAYWELGQKEKAKMFYKKYINLMRISRKESKIQSKVFERTN